MGGHVEECNRRMHVWCVQVMTWVDELTLLTTTTGPIEPSLVLFVCTMRCNSSLRVPVKGEN